MRDETNLRRLGEIGIDVYRRRADDALHGVARAAQRMLPASAAPQVAATQSSGDVTSVPLRFLLLAETTSPRERSLLADIVRALTSARSACAHAVAPSDAALSDATALVVFGEAGARGVGARLPAQRQREIGWVVTSELAALAAQAPAKRALWSELKRTLRSR